MFFPTATEQQIELEPVVRDPFIDDLTPRRPAPTWWPRPDEPVRRIVD